MSFHSIKEVFNQWHFQWILNTSLQSEFKVTVLSLYMKYHQVVCLIKLF
jgi:hypothetical protein